MVKSTLDLPMMMDSNVDKIAELPEVKRVEAPVLHVTAHGRDGDWSVTIDDGQGHVTFAKIDTLVLSHWTRFNPKRPEGERFTAECQVLYTEQEPATEMKDASGP